MSNAAKVMLALAALVFGLVTLIGVLAVHREDEPTAQEPDLSSLASDIVYTHKDEIFAPCQRLVDIENHAHGTKALTEAAANRHTCLTDYIQIHDGAKQVLRVEDSGFARHDMDIALQLNRDRRNLAAELKAFHAKWDGKTVR